MLLEPEPLSIAIHGPSGEEISCSIDETIAAVFVRSFKLLSEPLSSARRLPERLIKGGEVRAKISGNWRLDRRLNSRELKRPGVEKWAWRARGEGITIAAVSADRATRSGEMCSELMCSARERSKL